MGESEIQIGFDVEELHEAFNRLGKAMVEAYTPMIAAIHTAAVSIAVDKQVMDILRKLNTEIDWDTFEKTFAPLPWHKRLWYGIHDFLMDVRHWSQHIEYYGRKLRYEMGAVTEHYEDYY